MTSDNLGNITDIFKRHGTSLAETKAMMGELLPALEERKAQATFPEMPQFFTSADVEGMGLLTEAGEPFTLEEGWMLKLTPGVNGAEPAVSFITPEKWEITQDQTYISPEGQSFTKEELEQQIATPEIPIELEDVFGKVFPLLTEKAIKGTLAYISQSDENLNDFLNTLRQVGDTAETRELLTMLFPEQSEEVIGLVFATSLFTEIKIPTIIMSENYKKDVYDFIKAVLDEGLTSEKGQTIIKAAQENPGDFLAKIRQIGWNSDTEKLLAMMFPGITMEDFQKVFNVEGITEIAGAKWEATSWTAGPASWSESIHGFPGLMDLMAWLAPTKLGATINLTGSYLEKYVNRPWEAAILDARAHIQIGIGQGTDMDYLLLQREKELIDKYGYWGSLVSEDVSKLWGDYVGGTTGATKVILEISSYLNPVYMIPIGGSFGQAAKWTSKIPLLGTAMERAAAFVNGVEKGILYPITKPVELGFTQLEKLSANLGEQMVKKILGQTENILLEIPGTEALVQGVVVDNWVKKVLQLAAKVPFIRGGIEKGLGWRVLVSREGQLLEDIVGRGGVAYAEIQRMGINAAKLKVAELYAIDANPVKLFGFNKAGFSEKMLKQLLPDFAEQKGIAGTLEHVFTNPEMYNLTEKQLLYITRVSEINNLVLNLLKKEGVAPAHVIEDWIHRIVTGRVTIEGEEILTKGRPGMGGRGIGAKPSYEKPRTFETMADGLAEGYKYDPDITHSVGTYIQSAFNKIAAERFEQYTAKFGATPLERLMERYPGLAERVAFTQTELANAANFQSVINRAIRGEQIPEQTLRAIEKRFPELGKKFRALVDQPTNLG